MALKVRFDPQAARDLAQIRSYLIEHAGTASAERVRKHLRQRIDRLRRAPAIGIATSHPAIRLLSPTRYPYRVYFTVTADAVIVLHIRHSSRRDPDLDDLVS